MIVTPAEGPRVLDLFLVLDTKVCRYKWKIHLCKRHVSQRSLSAVEKFCKKSG